MAQTVRMGIIGTGNFTLSTMLPNLQKIPDVEVVTICNRSPETNKTVSEAFGIARTTTDYKEVLAQSDIDAVLVGTQPYLHLEAVTTALSAGKHVLCQTRMAENSADARTMHEAAEAAKARGLKTMLARPDSYVKADKFIRHLLSTGYIGRLNQVIAYRVLPNFVDSKAPLQRRQNIKAFGPINPMHIGFYWDVLSPWFGDARRVLAQRHTFTTEREETPGGPIVKIELPDTVTAIAEMESGAIITNTQLWAARFGGSRIEIYGEDGTIFYSSAGDQIMGGHVGDEKLAPLPIPDDMAEPWHVEADFIAAIRGEMADPRPSFLDGVKNMEYLEAVYQSGNEGRWVDLPKH